ncbi:MAG TPA: type III PLP-dependent enzyme [Jatrophihabitans sp.]|nr:type III PLP-dependent enzyme [Jatrophihabitans sp.]
MTDLTPTGLAAVLAHVEPPAYVYDLEQVRRAYRQLRQALPEPSRILYSVKANPHPRLIRTLTEIGAGAEVSSVGELANARAAGVPAGDLLYTGPGKQDVEIAEALRSGVRWFSADSPAALGQIDRLSRRAEAITHCLLRLNPDSAMAGKGLAMTGQASQFGADVAWIQADPAAFRLPPAAGAGATLAGFHVYQGSNLDSEDALIGQFDAAIAGCRQSTEALGIEPRRISLGGGFGAPFARAGELPRFPRLADRLAGLLDQQFPGWRQGRPAVLFESGRYLASRSGQLITRVADVKRSYDTPVVVLESGINHLGGMSGLRRLPPLTPQLARLPSDHRPPLEAVLVTGPLCTPLDTWARGVDLPTLLPGDLVLVPNVGAYGLTASLVAFLSHPIPAEVVLDRDEVIDVSRLELVRCAVGRESIAAPADTRLEASV